MIDIPRRADMQRWIPAEHQINEALQAVEALGAHPELTGVVTMLSDAQRRLADWYDGGRPGAYRAIGQCAQDIPASIHEINRQLCQEWIADNGT